MGGLGVINVDLAVRDNLRIIFVKYFTMNGKKAGQCINCSLLQEAYVMLREMFCTCVMFSLCFVVREDK